MITLFSLVFVVYAAYATLPFLNLGQASHYAAGCFFAICGSLLWVSISRSVPKEQIAIYGLYFDAVITVMSLGIPIALAGFHFTSKQIAGILIIIAGAIVTKM